MGSTGLTGKSLEQRGEWAGAIAVVATLFYLARQIRQSNQLGSAHVEREWFDASHEVIRSLGSNQETGDIVQRGLAAYEALTASERTVFHTRFVGLFNQTDLARRLHAKGLLDQDILDAGSKICISIVLTDGGGDWWWSENGPQDYHCTNTSKRCERSSEIP